ncbi:MAG: histidine kinase dimerization/phosphoacceptor domain -containing protein [Methanoregula sp.]
MPAGSEKREDKKPGSSFTGLSLRENAEEQLSRSKKNSTVHPSQTAEELIHELQVHQIELEMQAEELRNAHLALKESFDKYLDLYDFAPVAYFTLSREGLVEEVNLTGAALLGIDRIKLLKKKFSKNIAENDAAQWHRYFADVSVQKEKLNGIISLKRGDGSVFPARIEGIGISGISSGITGIRIAVSDISDIRQMEAVQERTLHELATAQKQLTEAHRLAHIGTWDWIIETDTVTWSEEMYKIAGRDLSLPAPTYAEHPQIYSPESWNHLSSAVTRALNEKEPYTLELVLIRPDGSTRTVNAFGGVKQDEKGNIIGLHGLVQDITEQAESVELVKKFGENLEREVARKTAILEDVNQKLLSEISIRIDAEKHLIQSVGEKEVLLREVHHRVKNNLQIIISLLNLQARYITDVTTQAAFRESQGRIRAMALVHEKLYRSADITHLDLDSYLRFLMDNLFQFFDMSGKGIVFSKDIRDIFLPIDTAIPMGLILNELFSNSLKYAFPDGRKGEISLVIYRQGKALTILYKDNGIGIPEDFDWRNPPSLGLRLVCSLVEQLDGTIELDRSSGTAFTIVVRENV